MSATPPSFIRVGPLTYRVLMDAAAIRAASDDADLPDDAEWGAFSNHRACIIGINPSEALGAQQMSLIHEVLHCALRLSGCWPNAYAVEWVRNRRNSGVDVEEHVVAGTAGPLLGVLQDNPELVQWLAATG